MSFRFDNGRGAITCDRCNIIVKYGYYTPEQHPSPHYCEDFGLECESKDSTDKGDNNDQE